MIVYTLLENTKVDTVFKARHGLSLLIETENSKILFDTGPDDAFIYNANLLGKDLRHVDAIVLSHGHKDHTGGLNSIMHINDHVKVYSMIDKNQLLYSKQKNSTYKDISMPVLDFMSSRFHYMKDKYKILDNVYIMPVSFNKGYIPESNDTLYSKKNGVFLKDNFSHELILCIKESDGLVIFTGCSHSGIGNMLKTVSMTFPGECIKAVFGGMHLFNRTMQTTVSLSKITQLSKELLRYNKCQFYTGHCTGKEAFDILNDLLKNNIHQIKSGSVHRI